MVTWGSAPLGENQPEKADAADDEELKERTVLVIRGDLLRRYPNTVIYAINAVSGPDGKLVGDV